MNGGKIFTLFFYFVTTAIALFVFLVSSYFASTSIQLNIFSLAGDSEPIKIALSAILVLMASSFLFVMYYVLFNEEFVLFANIFSLMNIVFVIIFIFLFFLDFRIESFPRLGW